MGLWCTASHRLGAVRLTSTPRWESNAPGEIACFSLTMAASCDMVCSAQPWAPLSPLPPCSPCDLQPGLPIVELPHDQAEWRPLSPFDEAMAALPLLPTVDSLPLPPLPAVDEQLLSFVAPAATASQLLPSSGSDRSAKLEERMERMRAKHRRAQARYREKQKVGSVLRFLGCAAVVVSRCHMQAFLKESNYSSRHGKANGVRQATAYVLAVIATAAVQPAPCSPYSSSLQAKQQQFELQYAGIAAELEEARQLNAELRTAVAVQEAVKINREVVETILQAAAGQQPAAAGPQHSCSDACSCGVEGAAACWERQPFSLRVQMYSSMGRKCEPMRQLLDQCGGAPDSCSLEPRCASLPSPTGQLVLSICKGAGLLPGLRGCLLAALACFTRRTPFPAGAGLAHCYSPRCMSAP